MIKQNSEDNQNGVYILDQSCSDFLIELAAYNRLNNLGQEIYMDIDNKVENKEINIEKFWFLGV